MVCRVTIERTVVVRGIRSEGAQMRKDGTEMRSWFLSI